MNRVSQLITAHDLEAASRRRATGTTRLGGPWWSCAMCVGGINLLLQVLLPGDVGVPARIAIFVVMMLLVVATVARTSRVLARRDADHDPRERRPMTAQRTRGGVDGL